jgi:crotonobetainyl-CoA:carnitine CoA-transferase CaiB-like acyl-CoA transferase
MTQMSEPRDSGLLARFAGELGLDARGIRGLSSLRAPLSSHLGVGELAWCSVAVAGAALASASPSSPAPASPAPDLVAAAYRSDRYLRIDDRAPEVWSPLSGFWRTSDGWMRTHANYPHHASALLQALRLSDSAGPDDLAAALRAVTSHDAVSAIVAAGGVGAAVRPEDPGTDAELRRLPSISLTRMGESPARPLSGDAALPLAGVRVLDLTRVLAGPVATRTLALAGADVLRIDPPARAEIAVQHLDTGHGKRSALLDIAADRARFEALLTDADVLVLGYRPSGLRRLGLDPAQLSARHPHLAVAQLSAWPGAESPRGFDSIVQADCGISWIESADAIAPGALPAQALDHSAGYLLAAGITMALRRRGEQGGGWYVRTSLRRVAAELLGMPRAEPLRMPEQPARTQTFGDAGHHVTTVVPAVTWPGAPELFAAPHPWGSDAPEW